jgi:hypothetical protein
MLMSGRVAASDRDPWVVAARRMTSLSREAVRTGLPGRAQSDRPSVPRAVRRMRFGLWNGSRLATSTEPVAIGWQRSRIKPPR